MYHALTVDPATNRISGIHDCALPFVEKHFAQNPELASHTIIPTRNPGLFTVGFDLRAYNAELTAEIDIVLAIQQGYRPMPEGFEIVDGILVKKETPEQELPPDMQEILNEARNKMAEQEILITELLALLIAGGVITNV